MHKIKKKYGQNFLKSELIANKIVDILELKNENVLEVGPGNFALTNLIIKKKVKKLIAIEIDKEICDKNKNDFLHNFDALKFDEVNFFKKCPFIIISNLPFNISNKLLIKWVKLHLNHKSIKAMVLMFQKELGERIVAGSNNKKYGRLSILAQSVFKITEVLKVKKDFFYPLPKVDAVVLKFIPLKKGFINKKNFEKLEKITNVFFNSRRKKNEKKIKQFFSLDQINQNGFGKLFNLRPENISKETYYKMSKLI